MKVRRGKFSGVIGNEVYVNKFDQPPPGSRIFIWTRQVVNGRKDALKRTHADVPPPEK
jgi:hypothetical protein